MININMLLATDMPDSIKILFVALSLLASVVVGFFIVKSIIKERKEWSNRENKIGFMQFKEFEEYVRFSLKSTKHNNLAIFRLEINGSNSLLQSIGSVQYDNALVQLIEQIRYVFDSSTRFSKYSEGTIYISMIIKENKMQATIENICKQVLTESVKSIPLAGILKVEFDINLGVVKSPDNGRTLEELMSNLELAIVAAKRKGINQFSIFSFDLSNKETEEYKNYLEIKEAIENKEFTLYYQPIIDLTTSEVFAAESLLRWNHKERGVLPPSTFLSIMEHTGDINWVGFWAIEQLFMQSMQWKSQYPDVDLKFSINLSEKQLMNNGLAEELRRLIKKHKIKVSDFMIEITESLVLSPVKAIQENISKLQQLGFSLTVDGYGGINSSLQIFSHYNLNTVKLSSKFVNDSKEDELVLNVLKLIIDYARKNNILVIAEGIEDEEALGNLKSLGIKFAQGYYFARPGSSTDLMNAVLLTPWQSSKKI